jgi:hypothetical protein
MAGAPLFDFGSKHVAHFAGVHWQTHDFMHGPALDDLEDLDLLSSGWVCCWGVGRRRFRFSCGVLDFGFHD